MIINLSKKQEAFIALMKENDDEARYGFSLLNKKDNLLDFYDALSDNGFFDSEKIIKTGAYEYLKQAVITAKNNNRANIIQKIIDRLHILTKEICANKNQSDENYWLVFARIFSELPASFIKEKDIHLMKLWLKIIKNPLTDAEIGEKLIPNLLSSDLTEDHSKASLLLAYYTEILWVPVSYSKDETAKFKMSDYCVSTTLEKYAKKFGEVCGKEACEVLIDKIKKIYAHKNTKESWIWLPAIEDHPQNVMKDESINVIVFALRDTLLSWFTTKPNLEFLMNMINSDIDVLRRTGIFIFNKKFNSLSSFFDSIITPHLFQREHLHEAYNLLNNRFTVFSDKQKEYLIDVIKNLPPSMNSKDKELSTNYLQQRYLHAIFQQGSSEADQLYLDLTSKIGAIETNHPDFYIYMESWQSSDGSPYSAKELISFLNDGILINKLNNFQEKNELRSPNIRGLVRVLGEAIKISPKKFVLYTSDFFQAEPAYQYGFINGYFDLWKTDTSSSINSADWDEIWKALFEFFDYLLLNQAFWECNERDNGDLIPKKSWLPRLISDFIRSGLQSDDKAFSQDLLTKAFIIIKELLKHLTSESLYEEKDAMTQAINSSKGKIIETLVNYALRKSRLSEKMEGNHLLAWEEVKPIFDNEIAKCRDDNFEFSTLLGSYIENINYLSSEWLKSNLELLFPERYPKNFSCTIQGLAYSQGVTTSVYHLLKNHHIFELSLTINIEKKQIKNHLMQRIALAYLWGEENIDSSLFNYLFNNNKIDELSMIAQYFWSIQNQKIDSVYENKIIDFWRKCIEWCNGKNERPEKLFQKLNMLSCYLSELDEEKTEWLLMSAPFITSVHNDRGYIQKLNYFADKSQLSVLAILEKLLEYYVPHYDSGDHFKSLLIKLTNSGDLEIRRRTLVLFNKLQNLPGFQELYENLKET